MTNDRSIVSFVLGTIFGLVVMWLALSQSVDIMLARTIGTALQVRDEERQQRVVMSEQIASLQRQLTEATAPQSE